MCIFCLRPCSGFTCVSVMVGGLQGNSLLGTWILPRISYFGMKFSYFAFQIVL